jgi:hypothetical protein
MGGKRGRKKAEDRSVWAVILKGALVILQAPYAEEEEEKEEEEGEEDDDDDDEEEEEEEEEEE